MIREFYADGDIDPNDTDLCYPDTPVKWGRKRGIGQAVQSANRENAILTAHDVHRICYPVIDLLGAGTIRPIEN